MTAEGIAKALGGRRAGDGWMARCPAHDDREPSLSIRQGEDGKVLVRCDAGCEQAIGAFIGRNERQAFHGLQTGAIPGRKEGGTWVSSKTVLREHYTEFPA
jgi:hypothetical protein